MKKKFITAILLTTMTASSLFPVIASADEITPNVETNESNNPEAQPRVDRKSTRLNSSHVCQSRMPSSA